MSRSTNRQCAVAGPLQQLDRVAETAVLHAEGQQPFSTGDAHRSDVVQRQPDPATQPPEHHRVAHPGVPGPHPAGDGSPTTDREVGRARRPRARAADEVRRVHRSVTVHDGDVVGGRGLEPGVHGCAVAGTWLVDDRGAEPARHLGGVVARAVVDHDRTEAHRDQGQQRGQGRRLVATGDHHVAGGRDRSSSTVGAPGPLGGASP